MSYSCTDFTEDVLNQLVAIKAIRASDVPADDPQGQAGLALSSIVVSLPKNNSVRLNET